MKTRNLEILDETQIELMSVWWERCCAEKESASASGKLALAKPLPQTKPLFPINPTGRCHWKHWFFLHFLDFDWKSIQHPPALNHRKKKKIIMLRTCLWRQPKSKCGSRWCILSSISAGSVAHNTWKTVWFLFFWRSTVFSYTLAFTWLLYQTKHIAWCSVSVVYWLSSNLLYNSINFYMWTMQGVLFYLCGFLFQLSFQHLIKHSSSQNNVKKVFFFWVFPIHVIRQILRFL